MLTLFVHCIVLSLPDFFMNQSSSIKRASGLSIGFLQQEIILADSSVSVREFIEGSSLSDLETKMAACLEDPNRLSEWVELHEKYERLGGYRVILCWDD